LAPARPGDGDRRHQKNATELRKAGIAAGPREAGRAGSAPHAAAFREAGQAAELREVGRALRPVRRNVERLSKPQNFERLDETEGRDPILARG
jgi:hypothetical protein